MAKDLYLIGKGTYRVELTTLRFGTWKAPGKCSGKITLSVNDDEVGGRAFATADGTFSNIACYAM